MRFAFYGIPAFFIVSGAAMLGSVSAPRPLVCLGDSSYSIYLAHGFFASAYASALKHLPILHNLPCDLVILLAGVMTIALCSHTYALVERPLTKMLSTGTRSKPAQIAIGQASVDPAV
jgi:exopolysaccharide production protein ExoZ